MGHVTEIILFTEIKTANWPLMAQPPYGGGAGRGGEEAPPPPNPETPQPTSPGFRGVPVTLKRG